MYTEKDAKILIEIARKAINDKNFQADSKIKKQFSSKHGAFVTLKKNKELRGCIGYALPYFSLYDCVIKCARAAAFEDSRFEPVTKDEMSSITIEISILTVPTKFNIKKEQVPSKIRIGKDGLIIRKGNNLGLLLPQVFIEYKSSPEEALEMTCQKAGLKAESWKDNDTVIERFQAQIFYEQKPRGRIVEETLE